MIMRSLLSYQRQILLSSPLLNLLSGMIFLKSFHLKTMILSLQTQTEFQSRWCSLTSNRDKEHFTSTRKLPLSIEIRFLRCSMNGTNKKWAKQETINRRKSDSWRNTKRLKNWSLSCKPRTRQQYKLQLLTYRLLEKKKSIYGTTSLTFNTSKVS